LKMACCRRNIARCGPALFRRPADQSASKPPQATVSRLPFQACRAFPHEDVRLAVYRLSVRKCHRPSGSGVRGDYAARAFR
jgi:hypothetical protein